jgi:hypothetical protein
MIEADERVNAGSRRKIANLARKCGEVWLGKINVSSHELEKKFLWKWDGGLVRNFEACLVVPTYDDILERMIIERNMPDGREYSPELNGRQVDAIVQRVEELGGILLVWS